MRYFFTLAVGLSLFMGLAAQTEPTSSCLDELFQQRYVRSISSYDSLVLNCGQALMGYDSLADFALPELALDSEIENPAALATAFQLAIFQAYGERRRRNYAASNAILIPLFEAIEEEKVVLPLRICLWAYSIVGWNYRSNKKYAVGRDWVDKAIASSNRIYAETDSMKVELLLLGASFRSRFEQHDAVRFTQSALDEYQRLERKDSNQLFSIHVSYSNAAEKYMSIQHANEALSIGRDIFGEDNNDLALLYFNTANSYVRLHQYEKAKTYLLRAAHIIETKTRMRSPLLYIWSSLGRIYEEQGENDLAILYLQKAHGISVETMGPDDFWSADALLRLGVAQMKNGDLVAAEENLLESQLKLLALTENEEIVKVLSSIENALGDLAQKRQQYDLAIQHYDRALNYVPYQPEKKPVILDQMATCYAALGDWPAVEASLSRAYATTPFNDGLELEDEFLVNYEHFMQILLSDARLRHQAYLEFENPEDLERSRLLYERLLVAIAALQRDRPEASSIANYRKEWYPVYAEAIDVLLLGEADIEQVFTLLEESTNSLLLGQLRSYRMSELSGIEAAQLDKEEAWQDSLLALRQERLATTEESPDFIIRETNFNDSLSQLRRDFAVANPQWYRLRYEQANSSLAEVQAQLEADELLLHFRAGEGSFYVFSVSQDASMMQSLTGWDQRQLETYIGHLNQAAAISPSAADELARSLYQQLLEEVLDQYGTAIQQLTIIPDGQLYQLPFESLQTSAGDWLMEHYVIRYATSASVLLEQMAMTPQAKRSFLGVAPDYLLDIAELPLDTSADEQLALLVRSGEYALPGAQQEVRQIQELFGGQVLLGAEAKKDEFLTKAGNYRVLHLAMHGLLDQDDPLNARLLFGGEEEANTYLTAAEIYQQSLQAQLAVLSACNTGSGQLSKGEGVMSLARAFTYAGVPSTVTSLWQVPDASTATIMTNFYDGLKNGLAKDVALQQAKLAYLNSVEDTPELQQPYYWAGFVLNGNRAALTRTNGSGRWWYLLGTLVVLGGLWARAKR